MLSPALCLAVFPFYALERQAHVRRVGIAVSEARIEDAAEGHEWSLWLWGLGTTLPMQKPRSNNSSLELPRNAVYSIEGRRRKR